MPLVNMPNRLTRSHKTSQRGDINVIAVARKLDIVTVISRTSRGDWDKWSGLRISSTMEFYHHGEAELTGETGVQTTLRWAAESSAGGCRRCREGSVREENVGVMARTHQRIPHAVWRGTSARDRPSRANIIAHASNAIMAWLPCADLGVGRSRGEV